MGECFEEKNDSENRDSNFMPNFADNLSHDDPPINMF